MRVRRIKKHYVYQIVWRWNHQKTPKPLKLIKQSERTCSILGPELVEVLASVDITSIVRISGGPSASLLLLHPVGSRWRYRHRLLRIAMRSGRRHLDHAILIWRMVGGARGSQLHRASVGTRGSWLLMPIVHTLLHVSTGLRARCLRSVGAGTCLVIALAAQQQIGLATGLWDIAIAGTVVMLFFVALKQMLAQATDRLCVAKDPRIVRLLLIIDIVPIESKDRLITTFNRITLNVMYARSYQSISK